MTKQGLNLFIVDDNELVAMDLKLYLQDKFGDAINISMFHNGETCLKAIDENTSIVILDYQMEGTNGLEVLTRIKEINQKTEVIMFSSNEDVAVAVESFKSGARDYVIKGQGSMLNLSKTIKFLLKEPINMIAREFNVSRYVATFLYTFVIMGIFVACALCLLK